jgi:hypothetical protein
MDALKALRQTDGFLKVNWFVPILMRALEIEPSFLVCARASLDHTQKYADFSLGWNGDLEMVNRVRRANASDVSVLAGLADKLIPGEASKSDRVRVLTRSLRRSNYSLYVAEEERRLLGFVDLWFFPDFAHGGKMGIIQNLFVDRTFRRRGIGDLLMRRVTHRASELKLKELHVWTTFRNRAAISLYRKHGLTRKSLLLEREFER